ncbi:hybrid sensor histidine kinase/response regulator [Teichococcus rhizosphaerae]|uniref:hybrid sensor histidine kinase/response regulator n=1 Tax=Teichococcus rhizosphaerae TaxID=1335062 RepID=UPI0011458252|nr:PAS domain-containing protein [Pseudoroseomonas rhizosphaerae]
MKHDARQAAAGEGGASAEVTTRLLRAQEAGDVHLFELGSDRVARCDDGLRGLFGIPPGDKLDHARWLASVHPEDRARLREDFERLLREGGSTDIEYRVLLPDGAVRWLCSRARMAADPGRPGSIYGATFDVTERRLILERLQESQRALEESSERLRLTLEAGRMGAWDWDLVARRWRWDRKRFELFGLGADTEEPGLDAFLAMVHPEDRPRLEAAVRGAVEAGDGTYECEYRVQLPGGVTRWLTDYGRALPGPDGRAVRLLGLTFDVTERRAAEADRDSAMALLRSFIEAVPGIVYAKDLEGRMLFANEGLTALIGKPSGAFIGRTAGEFIDDGQQAAALMESDRAVMETGNAKQFEEELGFRDGQPITWLSTKAPLRDEAGRTIGLVGTSLDITERKKAEAIIARGKAELERLVEERTRDLRETQAQLAHAQRIEALGQLAGGIAHDFNNVLQAIEDGARLIERRAGKPEAVRHLAGMVIDAARRGASITRRLLSFSRRDELRGEPLEPADLFADLREILPLSLGAGVAVRVEAEAGLPPLLADKGQLETVLVNLATNARDAMGGSGTLALLAAAETYPGRGGPSYPVALKPGRYVRLSVSDTGHGMDAGTLARATEPFFTTKEPGKGTGLGLAMARGFAEQSGGGLHIASAPGQGTTVTLWLPVADAGAAPAERAEGAAPPAAERRRILLVDDYDLMREMLAENLSDAGYEVVQAEDGVAALALVEAGETIDLLVSDLSMPGMNGVALIREAQRRRPGLPAILLTGFAGDAAELRGGEAEGASFSLLRKPVIGPELARCVASLLKAAPG